MNDRLEKTLGEVDEALSEESETSEPQPKKPRSKKVVKKAKKVAKKVARKSSNGSSDGKVTLAELAHEAEISSAAARRKLRDAELSREGRWAWEPGSRALKDARKALGLEG